MNKLGFLLNGLAKYSGFITFKTAVEKREVLAEKEASLAQTTSQASPNENTDQTLSLPSWPVWCILFLMEPPDVLSHPLIPVRDAHSQCSYIET